MAQREPDGLGWRITAIPVVLLLVAGGVVIGIKAGGSAVAAMSTYGWEQVTCEIEDSWINPPPNEMGERRTVGALYHYQWEGTWYESRRFSLRERIYTDQTTAGQVLMRYTPGARPDCYVNPEQPSEAVLKRDPGWIIIMYWIGSGLGWLLVGCGGLIAHQMFWPTTTSSSRSPG